MKTHSLLRASRDSTTWWLAFIDLFTPPVDHSRHRLLLFLHPALPLKPLLATTTLSVGIRRPVVRAAWIHALVHRVIWFFGGVDRQCYDDSASCNSLRRRRCRCRFVTSFPAVKSFLSPSGTTKSPACRSLRTHMRSRYAPFITTNK